MKDKLREINEKISERIIRKHLEEENSFIMGVLSNLGLVNGTETQLELLEIFKDHKVTKLVSQHQNPHPDAFYKFVNTFIGIQVDGVDYLYENYGK